MPSNADRYWAQFVASLPDGADRSITCSSCESFGFSPDDAREIAQLVLAGRKTATGSLLWTYERDGKRVPRAGDYWIVIEADDAPVCIVETIEARILPFDEVTADYARDGGEGDLSMEFWREIYRRYIVVECARLGRAPSEKAPLVMERFRVVYREPLVGGTVRK
jgi:uncharacterized protein YhfF